MAGGTFDLATNLDAGVLVYNPAPGAGTTRVNLSATAPAGRVLHIRNNSSASPTNDFVNVVADGGVTINGQARPVPAPYRVPGRWEALLVHQGAGAWYARNLESKVAYVGMSFRHGDGATILQTDYPDYGMFLMGNVGARNIQLETFPIGGRVLVVKRTGGGAVGLIGTVDGVAYPAFAPLNMTDTSWLLIGHSEPPDNPVSFGWQIVSKMP